MDDSHHPAGPTRVVIRVRGPLGPTLREAFPNLTVRREGSDALLCGTLCDQSALYGVLYRIEALGLELLEVTRDPSPTRPPTAGSER